MPLRNSYGFPDSGIISGGDLNPESKLERAYRRLLTVYAVVHIIYWFAAGCFLVLLPWQSFWDNNGLIFRFPRLHPFVANPFLKGAVVGLGLVNIIVGIGELIRFANSRQNRSN